MSETEPEITTEEDALRETIRGIVREELNEETLLNLMAQVTSNDYIREIVRQELENVGETMDAVLVEDSGFIVEAHRAARDEIRSLAGLMLRRTQDRATPAEAWGEALNDFSKPIGEAPS